MPALTCPSCGQDLAPNSRFCVGCGASVLADLPPAHDDAPTSRLGAVWDNATTSVTPAGSGLSEGPYQAAPPPPRDPSLNVQPIQSGLFLLRGERTLHDVEFAPRLLAPHLKTRVVVTDKRVMVRHPHTIFGFIPMGYAAGTANHSSVELVHAGTFVRTGQLVIGGLLALFGLASIFGQGSGPIVGLLLLVIGGALVFTARQVGLILETGGGRLFGAARGPELGKVEDTVTRIVSIMATEEKSRSI